MTTDNPSLTAPAKIAERAEAIYEEQFKVEVEAAHDSGFVAVDVLNMTYYFAETSEAALLAAREAAPHGVFHLIRIGEAGTVSSSYGWDDGTSASWTL